MPQEAAVSVDEGEEERLEVAIRKRAFKEEELGAEGHPIPARAMFLGELRQPSGKLVRTFWALEGDLDVTDIQKQHAPRLSGRRVRVAPPEFPEVDRAG